MSDNPNIIDREASGLVKEYYADYGSYVNSTRALPSEFDGLKSVQRRLIYSTNQLPSKIVKSAEIVGATLKYHPHGDQACYSSLITMTWPGCTFPLFDKQGNFGSKSFPAAAMRYTGAKLSDLAKFIYCQYIDYAEYTQGEGDYDEPKYLPSLLPYALLCNTDGIGVGVGVTTLALDPLDLCDLYLAILTHSDYPIMRLNAGSNVVYNKKSEVSEMIYSGKGSVELGPNITKTKTGIEISELPSKVTLKRFDKKIEDLLSSGVVYYRNDSTDTEKYSYIIDRKNRITVDELYDLAYHNIWGTSSFNFAFSYDESAVFTNLLLIVKTSLSYLKECIHKKFIDDLERAKKRMRVFEAIERIKDHDLNEIKSLTDEQYIQWIMDVAQTDREIAVEVKKKPNSYFTRSHQDEIDELREDIRRYESIIEDPTDYLISQYEVLKKRIEEVYTRSTVYEEDL